MPKVILNNKVFLLRWPEEADNKILSIGRKYRKGKYIDWMRAYKDGALKGIPAVSLNTVSKRHTYLKMRLSDPEGFLKKKREQNIRAKKKRRYHNESLFKRLTVFNKVPVELKLKYGWRPKRIWTDEQKNMLKCLVKKYRRKSSINWKRLMSDNLKKVFPKKYHNNLNLLRRYYWNTTKRDRESHRSYALWYKYQHLRRYRKNQVRRARLVSKVVNEVLLKKHPVL